MKKIVYNLRNIGKDCIKIINEYQIKIYTYYFHLLKVSKCLEFRLNNNY